MTPEQEAKLRTYKRSLAAAGWSCIEKGEGRFATLEARHSREQDGGYAIVSCVRGSLDGWEQLVKLLKIPVLE